MRVKIINSSTIARFITLDEKERLKKMDKYKKSKENDQTTHYIRT